MTAPIPYIIEPLGEHHDWSVFSCGVEALDRYFKSQAGQERRRHVAYCFVAVRAADKALGGFYTLSAASVVFDELPEAFRKRLPRYPGIPAALLGRLAVDVQHRGQGLGDFLLFDAMRRTLLADLAATVLLVDAKDEQAANFYRRHGFLEIGPGRSRLYLPMARIAKIFS